MAEFFQSWLLLHIHICFLQLELLFVVTCFIFYLLANSFRIAD